MDPPTTGPRHEPEHLGIDGVDPRPNVPTHVEAAPKDLAADLEHTIAPHGEGVVVEQEFRDAEPHAFFDLVDHVARGAGPKLLSQMRAVAEGTDVGAATAGEQGGHRVPTGEHRVVAANVGQVPCRERQQVEIFDQRRLPRAHDLSVHLEHQSRDFPQRSRVVHLVEQFLEHVLTFP